MNVDKNEKYYEFENEYWRCSLKEIVDFCKGNRVFLYGAGKHGRFLKEQLIKHGIDIEAFVVTELLDGDKNVCEKPVIELQELRYDSEFMRLVICTEKYVGEMESVLKQRGISDYKILKIGYKKTIIREDENIMLQDSNLSTMEDGLLRIRITNKCPGKCDFCGQLEWPLEEQNLEMDSQWYLKYMVPLYSKIKVALITGGDSFFAEHSYEYMQYLSNEYPHITIMTESNGLTFNEKYQKLASDNLFITHFSLNASNEETFVKGCWSSTGGRQAYRASTENVKSYMELLDREGKTCFAPNLSMVINRNTANDIIPFLEYALNLKASYVTYFFDYRENNMEKDYFKDTKTGRKVLKQLMEMEKVLKDCFFISFRLWTPLKEISLVEKEIENESEEELKEKYSELLSLAHNRSVLRENDERNQWRRAVGKKELTLEEDLSFTLQTHIVKNKKVCKAAWKVLDIYPNGRMDFCSWHQPILYLPDFIKDDSVNWEEVINSREFCAYRFKMLNGDYTGCMKCCPIIREVHGSMEEV